VTASAGERDAAPRQRWFSLTRIVLSAGGLAAAIGSVIALTTNVSSWFSNPSGDIPVVAIEAITPIRYADFVHRDNPGERVSPKEALLQGKQITFSVETTGYPDGTRFPARLILHDLTSGGQEIWQLDPIVVKHARRCGCSDFFLPRYPKHRYYAELLILDRTQEGAPIANKVTKPFRGS
jgi:hypothetical protein